jgi:hypothetical protein
LSPDNIKGKFLLHRKHRLRLSQTPTAKYIKRTVKPVVACGSDRYGYEKAENMKNKILKMIY